MHRRPRLVQCARLCPIPPAKQSMLCACLVRPPPATPALACPAGVVARCRGELSELEGVIGKKEEEQREAAQQVQDARQQQAQLGADLQQKERRLQALYDKQGRSAQVGAAWVVLLRLASAASVGAPAARHAAAEATPPSPYTRSSPARRSAMSGCARRWSSCRPRWPRSRRTAAARSSSWRRCWRKKAR